MPRSHMDFSRKSWFVTNCLTVKVTNRLITRKERMLTNISSFKMDEVALRKQHPSRKFSTIKGRKREMLEDDLQAMKACVIKVEVALTT